jgi:origin recognition complex subunit 2
LFWLNLLHFQVISTVAEIFWDKIKERKCQPGTRSQLSQAFPSQSTDDIISFLKNQMSDDVDDHVCLLIHNIDGPALRDAESQQCLAQLSCCPHVHIVASIDHVNAPLCKFLLFYCLFVKVFFFLFTPFCFFS